MEKCGQQRQCWYFGQQKNKKALKNQGNLYIGGARKGMK
jgi:hypothetical protein